VPFLQRALEALLDPVVQATIQAAERRKATTFKAFAADVFAHRFAVRQPLRCRRLPAQRSQESLCPLGAVCRKNAQRRPGPTERTPLTLFSSLAMWPTASGERATSKVSTASRRCLEATFTGRCVPSLRPLRSRVAFTAYPGAV
jgi:hypothetical protein